MIVGATKCSAHRALEALDPLLSYLENNKEKLTHLRDELPESEVVNEQLRGQRQSAKGRSEQGLPKGRLHKESSAVEISVK